MDVKGFNRELSRRLGRDIEDINLLSEQLADVMGEALATGDSVSIPAFGSFEPKKRNERVTMHPSSGKRILIPPKLTVTFKPSAMLKTKVRKP